MGEVCPVTVRGVTYPSQKAAAKAFGLTPSAISQRLYINGHCDTVGLGPGVKGNTNARRCEFSVGPYTFPSQKMASELLGISRTTIRRFSMNECKAKGREMVVAAAMKKAMAGELKEYMT